VSAPAVALRGVARARRAPLAMTRRGGAPALVARARHRANSGIFLRPRRAQNACRKRLATHRQSGGARAFSRSSLPSPSTNFAYSTSQLPLELFTHVAVAQASEKPSSDESTSTLSPLEKEPVFPAWPFPDMSTKYSRPQSLEQVGAVHPAWALPRCWARQAILRLNAMIVRGLARRGSLLAHQRTSTAHFQGHGQGTSVPATGTRVRPTLTTSALLC